MYVLEGKLMNGIKKCLLLNEIYCMEDSRKNPRYPRINFQYTLNTAQCKWQNYELIMDKIKLNYSEIGKQNEQHETGEERIRKYCPPEVR